MDMKEEVLDDGPGMYMKKAAAFLREVMALAKAQKVSIPRVLCDMCPTNRDIMAFMIQKIDWTHETGYLTFQRQPKGNANGHMHIAMLAFSEEAYLGQGVYLSDALLMLEQRGLDEFTGA